MMNIRCTKHVEYKYWIKTLICKVHFVGKHYIDIRSLALTDMLSQIEEFKADLTNVLDSIIDSQWGTFLLLCKLV